MQVAVVRLLPDTCNAPIIEAYKKYQHKRFKLGTSLAVWPIRHAAPDFFFFFGVVPTHVVCYVDFSLVHNPVYLNGSPACPSCLSTTVRTHACMQPRAVRLPPVAPGAARREARAESGSVEPPRWISGYPRAVVLRHVSDHGSLHARPGGGLRGAGLHHDRLAAGTVRFLKHAAAAAAVFLLLLCMCPALSLFHSLLFHTGAMS